MLYVGGNISSAGGVPTPSGVAVWNGVSWSAVGNGPFLSPVDMAIYQGVLFVGGAQNNIVNPVGDTIQQIAWFDGVLWKPACSQLYAGEVASLTVFKNELYVAGQFDVLNNDTVYKIARTNTVPSSIQENSSEQYYKLSPNPVKDILSVKLLKRFKGEWKIYSSTGQMCQRGFIIKTDDQINIAVDSYKYGNYFIEINLFDYKIRTTEPFIISYN